MQAASLNNDEVKNSPKKLNLSNYLEISQTEVTTLLTYYFPSKRPYRHIIIYLYING